MTARRSTKSSSRPATPRSSRPGGSIRRVPRALERICLKAMAADPRSRYPVGRGAAPGVAALPADAAGRAGARGRRRPARPARAGVGVLADIGCDRHRTSSRRRDRRSSGRRNRGPSRSRSPQADLRVTRFEIPHFPKLDEKTLRPEGSRAPGQEIVHGPLEDDVTVQAELSEPAYSYLIAFRPDGTDELCDPDDEDTPPARKQTAARTRPRRRATSGTA